MRQLAAICGELRPEFEFEYEQEYESEYESKETKKQKELPPVKQITSSEERTVTGTPCSIGGMRVPGE